MTDLLALGKTLLYLAAALSIGLTVGELHGHSRGVDDDQAAANKQLLSLQAENGRLAVQDQVQEERIKTLSSSAQLEVFHVDTYIPAPGLAPVALPDPGYNRTFVCLWNLPLQGDTGGSGSAAAAACAHAPDAQELSAVTRDEVLGNELDNMGKCAVAYLRVATLQQILSNGQGGGKP